MEELDWNNATSRQWSRAYPGFVIFLTDGSVFASEVINSCIDDVIIRNFGGETLYNRCFISVVGYNHNVKELCSGWLQDLDASPLRYDTLKKKTPDGTGGIVEVEVKQPVWVEYANENGSSDILGALQKTKSYLEMWISDMGNTPIPIVFDVGCGLAKMHNISAVEQLKKSCFIFGVTDSDNERKKIDTNLYSNVPEEWIHRSYHKPEIANMNGLLTSLEMQKIMGQQHVGGQPSFHIINGEHIGWWELNKD